MFLSNHPNSVPVLQAAWHCTSQSQTVRGLVLHAMAEWYMRGEPHDQARLSRILDVAQDLKVCSHALTLLKQERWANAQNMRDGSV